MLTAKIKYTDGMQFVGEAGSGHAIVMDTDGKFGGVNTGLRPTELLLIAVGGCSGMDIVSVLKKKKQQLTGLEIIVGGEKAEEYPQKFTDINIEFIVKGRGLSEEAVKKAVDLSMDKYCSVKATLEGSAKFTFSYKIVEDLPAVS
ncbi:MAG: OsmC family protein [Nitrospirae bacterium]|nr:OsmC family protein [Nitrospirota bacterium]